MKTWELNVVFEAEDFNAADAVADRVNLTVCEGEGEGEAHVCRRSFATGGPREVMEDDEPGAGVRSLVRERNALRDEVRRLNKWDAQLRQWLFDHKVEVGEINLSDDPPAEDELLTLAEVREYLGLEPK